ncbi:MULTISPECIES: oligosaccharide flippase family protein [Ruegeria]|uniref:oligosaccharide flippase family protein n=1 Tax=Ruegeria TaxID=97050 RepID=UPI00147F05C0|nr:MULTISPECIES: oligosaccharide flippase family protein [Ruegeria]
MKQPSDPVVDKSTSARTSALAVGATTLLASSLFRQALGLITLIVTARLLAPKDFGIAAYFLVATAFLEMMQRQIATVLIRLDDVTLEHLKTVFTFQVILGVVAALFFYVTQPLLALLEIPELIQLAPILCALSLIIALKSPRFVLFERKLRFSFAAAEETISRIVYSIIAISLAWLWGDFWSIIVASVCALITRSIWTYSMAPMTIRLSLARWRDCLSFSVWTTGAQVSLFFSNNMPQLIIGATLGLADAGVFRLGNRLSTLVTTQLFAPLQRVLYPGLADISRNTDRQDEAFNRLNELLLAIVLPVSLGMALVANHIVVVVIGWQWLGIVQVIWILAPLKALETLHENVRSAAYIEGSTRILFIRNTFLLVFVCLLMREGVEFGFSGALIAAGIASLVTIFTTLMIAKRYGTRTFFGPITVAWRSFVSTLAMVSVVLFVSSAFGSGDAVGWAYETEEDLPLLRFRFAIKVLVGILTYIGTHFLLWKLSGKPKGVESMTLELVAKIRSRLVTAH